MNRIEFLKRLGLGVVASIAAPRLLKGEEKIIDESNPFNRTSSDLVKCGEQIKFWRRSDSCIVSSAFTLDIPPLKEGEYKYELTVDDKQILSGNIISK